MIAEKLKGPISWTSGDPEIEHFLDGLQGNILKFHGRFHIVHLFCHFREDMKAAARSFLRGQIDRVQTAKQQLEAAAQAKAGAKDPAPFVSVFLTKAGYDYLEVAAAQQPTDAKFIAGMPASTLGDPETKDWDSRLANPHAMVLVALGSFDEAQEEATRLLTEIGEIGSVGQDLSGEVIGTQYFNQDGRGIENFGYVDGRSQPLVLTEDDVTNEMPRFPVNQFVVPDPGGTDEFSYGSYFVFRQLQQNVFGFKAAEDKVEDILAAIVGGTKGMDSSVVGRREDGTPFVVIDDAAADPVNVTNTFDYEAAPPPHCPVFAHIRKVNPRTPETNGRLMIRRATTYGQRKHVLDAKDATKFVIPNNSTDRPDYTRKVGLLFQSYQANIERQFEWAQLGGASPELVDCVIGTSAAAENDFPISIANQTTKKIDFFKVDDKSVAGPFVKMVGGAYFFAPSIPFLRSI